MAVNSSTSRMVRAGPAMVSFGRGRSDAVFSLWRRAGNCAWQRALGARLAVSPDVAHGGHQSRTKRRPWARNTEGERKRIDQSARSRGADRRGKADCTCHVRAAKSEYRGADHCAGAKPRPELAGERKPGSKFKPKLKPGSGFFCRGRAGDC